MAEAKLQHLQDEIDDVVTRVRKVQAKALAVEAAIAEKGTYRGYSREDVFLKHNLRAVQQEMLKQLRRRECMLAKAKLQLLQCIAPQHPTSIASKLSGGGKNSTMMPVFSTQSAAAELAADTNSAASSTAAALPATFKPRDESTFAPEASARKPAAVSPRLLIHNTSRYRKRKSSEETIVDGEYGSARKRKSVSSSTPKRAKSNEASEDVTAETVGVKEAAMKEAAAEVTAAREGTEKEAEPNEAAANEAAAKKAAAKEAAAKEAAAREAAAKEAAAKKVSAKEAASQEAAAKEAIAKETAGKEEAARKVAGEATAKEALLKEAAAKEKAARKAVEREAATREAVLEEAGGKDARVKKAAAKEAAAKETTAKEVVETKAAVKVAAWKEAAAQEEAAKEITARKVEAKHAAATEALLKQPLLKEAAAKEASFTQTAAKEALSKQTAAMEASFRHTASKEPAAEEAAAKEAVMKKAASKEEAAKKAELKEAAAKATAAKSEAPKQAEAGLAEAEVAKAAKSEAKIANAEAATAESCTAKTGEAVAVKHIASKKRSATAEAPRNKTAASQDKKQAVRAATKVTNAAREKISARKTIGWEAATEQAEAMAGAKRAETDKAGRATAEAARMATGKPEAVVQAKAAERAAVEEMAAKETVSSKEGAEGVATSTKAGKVEEVGAVTAGAEMTLVVMGSSTAATPTLAVVEAAELAANSVVHGSAASGPSAVVRFTKPASTAKKSFLLPAASNTGSALKSLTPALSCPASPFKSSASTPSTSPTASGGNPPPTTATAHPSRQRSPSTGFSFRAASTASAEIGLISSIGSDRKRATKDAATSSSRTTNADQQARTLGRRPLPPPMNYDEEYRSATDSYCEGSGASDQNSSTSGGTASDSDGTSGAGEISSSVGAGTTSAANVSKQGTSARPATSVPGSRSGNMGGDASGSSMGWLEALPFGKGGRPAKAEASPENCKEGRLQASPARTCGSPPKAKASLKEGSEGIMETQFRPRSSSPDVSTSPAAAAGVGKAIPAQRRRDKKNMRRDFYAPVVPRILKPRRGQSEAPGPAHSVEEYLANTEKGKRAVASISVGTVFWIKFSDTREAWLECGEVATVHPKSNIPFEVTWRPYDSSGCVLAPNAKRRITLTPRLFLSSPDTFEPAGENDPPAGTAGRGAFQEARKKFKLTVPPIGSWCIVKADQPWGQLGPFAC